MNSIDIKSASKSTNEEVSLPVHPPHPPLASLSSLSSSNTVVSYTGNDKNNDEKGCMLQQLPTDIIYMTYEGNFITECRSKIVDVISILPSPSSVPNKDVDDKTNGEPANNQQQYVCIVLDRTVMHAQGGGQPTDIGHFELISNNDSTSIMESPKINITKVELDRMTGIVKHYGTTILPLDFKTIENKDETSQEIRLRIGDIIRVQVNVPQRQLLSECHTAGHVVDAAMFQCGFYLKPSKGYHFLDSPYVEYYYNPQQHNNSISINEKQDLPKLQYAFQQLLQQDIPTKIELLSKEEAHLLCNGSKNTSSTTTIDEPFFDLDMYCTATSDTIRIVTVAGYACPCGGTHVRSTGDLLRSSSNEISPPKEEASQHYSWSITGIKCKPKGYVRIKYGRIPLDEALKND